MNRVLIQCQQSIEVPEISIEIDPRVKILCEQNSNSLEINPDKQLVDDLATTKIPTIIIGDFNSDPRDPRAKNSPNPGEQPVESEQCPAQSPTQKSSALSQPSRAPTSNCSRTRASPDCSRARVAVK